VELPRTLHAQLYLLAYDREHHRFGGTSSSARWFFEFALRSAMLTELYLAGYLEDRDGKAHPVRGSHHDDPVLHEALNDVSGQDWARWIAHGRRDVRQVVGDQLEATGWVNVRRRRAFGVLPARHGVYDDDMVAGLGYRVIEALDSIIADRPAGLQRGRLRRRHLREPNQAGWLPRSCQRPHAGILGWWASSSG
jgi:hypothetical protein